MFKKVDSIKYIFIFGLLFWHTIVAAYEVRFEGIQNSETLKLIHSVSQLEKLKNAPPATLLGLKRRVEADRTAIIQALHSLAYYNATIDFAIKNEGELVIVNIDVGPLYPLTDFQVIYLQNGNSWTEDFDCPINLQILKVQLGAPALPKTILEAEDTLLDNLNLRGYAFASIKKRDVLVDQKNKQVTVLMEVETGPLTYFGPVTFSGLERVKKRFFNKKIKWQQDDIYDPLKIEKTQEALELSGLFRSVNIRHAEKPNENDYLPIAIDVIEAKQRSIGFGLNYNTELGPGIAAEWEDRNFEGEGEKLSFRADIGQKLQEQVITYLIPDFYRPYQNLIWRLDYNHERITAFTESSFSLSATIERQLTEKLTVSYGGMFKMIDSQRSDRNGTFDLVKIPLQFRWSNTDSLLDPTRGNTVQVKITPSFEVCSPQFTYFINTFTGTYYHSLDKDKRHILAAKLMLGTILGASNHEIPPPERFLAGSESALRGYKYLTVSPLDCDHKPIGGRSMFIYSLELRNRMGDNFGWVLFYEIGNVFLDSFPDIKSGLLRSAGIGLRYHTPIGPLRLDCAVPLNRRSKVDRPFQIYFSIGQAF